MKEKLKCFLTTEIESAKDETGTKGNDDVHVRGGAEQHASVE